MNTPLIGLRKTIVTQRQNGISVSDLAKKYCVSRQAIYNLLKKAEKEGEEIPWNRFEKKKNTCAICEKEGYFKSKTCSLECRKKLISQNLKKDSKWSRYFFLELVCSRCGKSFKRTKYQQAISFGSNDGGFKRNYCSRECFHNRCVVFKSV